MRHQKPRSRRALRTLVLATALVGLLLCVCRGARAAPLDPKGQDWEGLAQLVALAQAELGATRVVVTPSLDMRTLGRGDALLVVHPEGSLDVDELSSFMHAGGRIAMLDDYGTGDELLERFGIRRVPLPSHPAQTLRGNPAFAIAEAASTHSAVRDVGRVVTNHAVGLDHKALSAVLVVRGEGEPDVLLSVAGAVGQGRLLAVGDSSILMNSMLRYPGNRQLALALVRYATEDDVWGKRDGKLYVLTNGFETTGSFGHDTSVGGAVATAMRAFDDAIETLRRDGMPPLASYLLSLAVGLGVIAWTSARAGRPHRPATPRFVRPVAPYMQGGIAGRAAVLGAPQTARVMAMLELKSALEEDVATRLGLDRTIPADELAARARHARRRAGRRPGAPARDARAHGDCVHVEGAPRRRARARSRRVRRGRAGARAARPARPRQRRARSRRAARARADAAGRGVARGAGVIHWLTVP
jgi:hypothetical protein